MDIPTHGYSRVFVNDTHSVGSTINIKLVGILSGEYSGG